MSNFKFCVLLGLMLEGVATYFSMHVAFIRIPTLVGMFTFMKADVEQLVGRVGATIASLDLVDESLQQRDRLMDR